jgi:hypothetical protein
MIALIPVFSLLVFCPEARAVRPSEQLLPDTTVGYLSVPDVDALQASFDQTQLGELAQDPVMQPFVDDLKRQLRERLTESGIQLELTLEDLEGVYGGEVCLAMTQPGGDNKAYARAVLIDVTGHLDAANALLAKIDRNQLRKGAKKATQKIGTTTVVVYTLPKREEDQPVEKAFYFLRDDQLVATDNETLIKEIVARFDGDGSALAGVVAYRETMQRCAKRAGDLKPQVRWFVEPLGYAHAARAASGGRKRRGTDLLKVLANQGFDAVQGMGGYVNFSVGDDEILHRTSVYVPAAEGKGGKTGAEKYRLAARMMDTGPGQDLSPPHWVPRELATFMRLTWKMKDAFYFSKTLVNEIADDEVFEDVLDSIRDDPHGPQIDVRSDIVTHVGTRGALIGDYELPITTTSERLLIAIEMKDHRPTVEAEFAERDVDRNGKITENEEPEERRGCFRRLLRKFDKDRDGALTREEYVQARSISVTIDMAMENDPEARLRKVGDHKIWEIINEPTDSVALPEIEIEGIGFASFGDEEEEEEEEKELFFPNRAITFVHGHIMVATHIDLLVKLLEGAPAGDTLQDAADYQQVMAALQRLGASQDNLRLFARLDEASQATYQLFKEGKMPEAETVLGKLLNRMLGSGEEGVVREQEVDASKLPDFQIVRRYLGPTGLYAREEPTGDGWFIVGSVLKK